MENVQETKTLFKEMGDWNRQESMFRELFSEESLKDRDFMRMKLENYDKLYHKYNGKPLTTDEKALMRMLRFQRRKMEKILYPGLLRRMLHRGTALVKGLLARRRENLAIRRSNLLQYAHNATPLTQSPGQGRDQTQSQTQSTLSQRGTSLRQYPVSRFQPSLRRKTKIRRKGQGL
ncbi:hypothetical protein [Dinghuibacter silviterrae]|uniref:Uncharacterized protein n=1 Tax=Dinghuibacter silviterrae TaxID=1539049 RepID=A0A4R8DQT1_9BACT|nr:hypothetical protein [Dinghuibacter silviterrae]TDX00514.1 hypothetical protein EDB95_1539 [Dinghuibacter silviterrae]